MLPTKLSILFLYKRIFTLQRFRIAIYITMGICIVWFLGGLLPTIVQCIPVEYNWNRSSSGTCIDMKMLFAGITISNLLTDVLLLILPLFVISTLQLTLKNRLAVMGIFLLGGATCICSLIRVISQNRFGTDIMCMLNLIPMRYLD
jgi:hypothetical protein